MPDHMHNPPQQSKESECSSYSQTGQGLREELMRVLIENTPDLVWAKDATGRIILGNQATFNLLGGGDANKVLGMGTDEIIPDPQDAQNIMKNDARVMARNQSEMVEETFHAEGQELVYQTLKTPLHDSNGAVIGIFGVSRNITERRQIEQALRDSEERLRMALEASYAIAFTWDIQHDIVRRYHSKDLVLSQTDEQQTDTFEGVVRFVHPDDRATLRCDVHAALNDPSGVYKSEYRLPQHDGSIRWYAERGQVKFDQKGHPIQLIGLSIDITEQKLIEIEKNRLYREAQHAIKVRDDFLSVAAHELKTPLTTLMGTAQLLQRRAVRDHSIPPGNQRMISVIVDQAMRLNQMIADLLDVSRMEMGHLELACYPLDMGALARRVVDEIQVALEQHKISCILSETPLVVDGDALRLEQVLHNLISNAVKYSPHGGDIIVRLEPRDTQLCITVTDHGIGIPKSALTKLFQRFYRADNTDSHHILGMGIGLYVVHEIVRLHGGSVTVESTEGQGSTFTVLLPINPAG